MSRFWTVKEVARALHRHPRTIYRWLEEGDLRGKKVKDGWLIPEEELNRIIRDPFRGTNRKTGKEKGQFRYDILCHPSLERNFRLKENGIIKERG
jgi:excisionase family DNA binding protein